MKKLVVAAGFDGLFVSDYAVLVGPGLHGALPPILQDITPRKENNKLFI